MKFALLLIAASLSVSADSLWGVSVTFLPQSSPKPAGGAFFAIPVTANKQVWSFTEYDTQFVGRPSVVQVSTRSGLATPCKSISTITVFCLADAGVSSAGAQNGAAVAVGLVAAVPWKGFYFFPGFRYLNVSSPTAGAGGSTRYLTLGIGKRTTK